MFRSRFAASVVAALGLVISAGQVHAAPAKTASSAPALSPIPLPDIAYTRIVLKNGLTVIVHEDHKAPVVGVNLWYHVGSKDEPPGRTGFAHLFEHLMFGSTGGNQRGWFERLEGVGATGINGTTQEDRTNFFETVPTPALDMTLAMEAQRMGHLLDAFNETLLNTQRGVVQNEKRQDENQPYAVTDELITKAVWPASHPYSHTVIGEMTDLDAAKVQDVKDWFAHYYGPTNAVLVLAGDITVAEAQAKVEKYFGAIPPGPPVAHQKAWVAKRSGAQRAEVQDRVPQARLYVVWNVAPAGTPDSTLLALTAKVLGSGKSSRLYRRLVYHDQIATQVAAYQDGREIGSLMEVELTAKPGVPLERLEAAFHEELDRLLKEGPTKAELDRYKTESLSDFVGGVETVGGFGGKSDLLARWQTYAGDPGGWRKNLERIKAATPAEVGDAARRWLSDGSYTLAVTPFPDYAAAPKAAGDGAIPAPGAPVNPRFPGAQTATLPNGLKVVVAERHDVPKVTFALLVDAGRITDPPGLDGVAGLDLQTMLDGTQALDALAFDARKTELGVRFSAYPADDFTQVAMTALSSRLAPSMDLMADMVLHPAFRPEDLTREKALAIANVAQTRRDPFNDGFRLSEPMSFGPDHPYGRLVTEATITKATLEDVRRHHQTWFQPRGATLVVVGDTTLKAVLPLIEARFGGWKGETVAQPKVDGPPASPTPGTIYLVDKPGALQSVIVAGFPAPPKRDPDDIAIQAMVTTLGGAFTSRLNLNLREDKHWAYGAFAFSQDHRGPGLLTVLAPVQTDKTKESFAEIQRELKDVVGDRPLTARELELAQHNLTLSLPGQWQTEANVAGSLADIAAYGLPADYFGTYAAKVQALTLPDVQRAATRLVKPGAVTWVVIGDRSVVQAPLESLGFKIKLIDPDGKPAP